MDARDRRFYLQHLRIEHFGVFSRRTIGPFGPHMNIVYGQNEAGKTTVASFVGGVLFGWEEARGNRNTYRPEGIERSGTLFFAPGDIEPESEPEPAKKRKGKAVEEEIPVSSQDMATLSRARNADGLQGDVWLAEDIDKDTFRTMFSLNSDELRSLSNTTDTTAKLLTAGSGTGSSPAHALAHVNERLAAFTSRSAGAENSLMRLSAQRAELRERQHVAAEQADRLRDQDRELHQLEPERQAMAQRVEEANRLVEALTSAQTAVESLDDEKRKLQRELQRLRDDEAAAVRERKRLEQQVGNRLASLSAAEDRALRDRLDGLAEQEARQSHTVEAARSNYVSSKAVYDALLETAGDKKRDATNRRSKRSLQILFSIIVPVVLFLLGIPLFLQGRALGSMTYLALGVALLLFAALMTVAGFVMIFRPDREDLGRKERFDDAQWVMVQDEKKLEACAVEADRLAERIRQALDEEGLSQAEGSIRQGRTLLDEARETRSSIALCIQRQQAAASRASQTLQRLEEVTSERARALSRAHLDEDAGLDDIEEELAHRTHQRAGLLEAFEALNQRVGELTAILAAARDEHDFDRLKIEAQQLNTRLDEARADFARLLLAKRMLEAAIAAWESKRQPEVYEKASRLLALMTNGRWTEVSLTAEGTLQVTDALKVTRAPVHLSLGTCQQLYLALRIALLTTAENVGRAIPTLADDILVNFDAARRVGAARALAELATQRQVILFTCHEEVVRVLKKAAKQTGYPATIIDL